MRVLEEAQELLDHQNILVLPKVAQLRLLEAQRYVYQEIQALQARKIVAGTQEYILVTQGLKRSESGFRAIHDWARSAAKTGEAVSGLLKGLALVLTLL